MKHSKTLLGILSLGLFACERGVPMMGIDETGKLRNGEISHERYTEEMKNLVGRVQENTLPALETRSSKSTWELRTVMVGLGLRMEAGIGPYKLGAEPRLRLAFTKDESAPIP